MEIATFKNSKKMTGWSLFVHAMVLSLIITFSSCGETVDNDGSKAEAKEKEKTDVIFDTDANNEIDDQHALAYLLFNGNDFAVEGVTVNATSHPKDAVTFSDVRDHYDEAKRVMQLCGVYEDIPLFTGADGSFEEIRNDIDSPDFDGHEAVDFIIEQALRERDHKLVLLPVGKLTNIALALLKEPSIAENIRIVWLGSNYPEPGEHNQNWDIESMNYVLDVDVPFEMVTVRYQDATGTEAVKVTQAQILHRMPGKGPVIDEPVTGRHGGQFNNWGDYSANLFKMYGMGGNPPSRSLYDQAAVAIVKNPDWAERYEHPAPVYIDGEWVERPENTRMITIWEWFDIYGIVNDYFVTMDNYALAERP